MEEDTLGSQFWQKHINQDEIRFGDLFSRLVSQYPDRKDDLLCAKPLIHYCLNSVTITQSIWNAFFQLFGPLDNDLSFISRLEDLFSIDCFTGYTSAQDADKIVQNQPKGSFILRFSTTQTSFVITFRDEITKHIRYKNENSRTYLNKNELRSKTA